MNKVRENIMQEKLFHDACKSLFNPSDSPFSEWRLWSIEYNGAL